MRDLDERFRYLDEFTVPDLHARIEARSRELPPPTESESRSGPQRLIAAIVAILVFLGAGAIALRAFGPEEQGHPTKTPIPTNPLASFPTGWTRLPEPP